MFCKHCGKEIKDGMKFCPKCGKPTGVATEKKKEPKKPNPKILLAVLGVVVIVFVLGKKFVTPDSSSHVANKDSYTEDNGISGQETNQEGGIDYNDKKIKRKRAYKRAYKEEYNSFDTRMKAYCEEKNEKYHKMVDQVAEGLNDAYEGLEKVVPNISTYIGADVGNAVADSYTGVGIVSELTKKAIENEQVRKIGAKTLMYLGSALWDYTLNATTTKYPFGFQIVALNKEYALLRSNGTYKDMTIVVDQSMSYSLKMDMLSSTIEELQSEALQLQSGEDKDAYYACMGRLAANQDLEKEWKEFYQKCMAVIACSGNVYGQDPAEEIKLYWIVSKDDRVHNTFWAPMFTCDEKLNFNFNFSLSEDGSCFLTSTEGGRVIIGRDGKIMFQGTSLEQLAEAPVGSSTILTYGVNEKALQKRKVKDNTYGTYYVLEIVDKKGRTEKVLDVRETQVVQSNPHYEGNVFSDINWYDAIVGSRYARVGYETLDHETKESVIDLENGTITDYKEFQNAALEEALQSKEEGIPSAQQGRLEEGWIWNEESGVLSQENDVIFMTKHGLSEKHSALNKSDQRFDASKFAFNQETFLKNIGESREVLDCYCRNGVVWVVTRSGYFYTYDLDRNKKSKEVEIGENVSYSFTPYGLLAVGKNEKGKAKIEFEGGSGKETEHSVYQYDASGACVAKYPAYQENLNECVYQFLYGSGQDTYNLSTHKMFELQ